MNKAVRIALIWIITLIIVAISYFGFVLPYENVKDPGFIIWSLGKPLSQGILLLAVIATWTIHSKKRPR